MKLYEEWIDQILDTLNAQVPKSPCGLVLLEPEDFTFRTFMRFERDDLTLHLETAGMNEHTPWVEDVRNRLSQLGSTRSEKARKVLASLVSGESASLTAEVAYDLLRSIAAPPFAFVSGAYFADVLGIEPQEPLSDQIRAVKALKDRHELKVEGSSTLFSVNNPSYEHFEFVRSGCAALYAGLFNEAFPKGHTYVDYTFCFYPLLVHGMFLGNLYIVSKDVHTKQVKDIADWSASVLTHFQYPRFRDIIAAREYKHTGISIEFLEALHRVQPGIAAACHVDNSNGAVTKAWHRKARGLPQTHDSIASVAHGPSVVQPSALVASSFHLQRVETILGTYKPGSVGDTMFTPSDRWQSTFLEACRAQGFPLSFGTRFQFSQHSLEVYYTALSKHHTTDPAVPDVHTAFSTRLHALTLLDTLKRERITPWNDVKELYGDTTFTVTLPHTSIDVRSTAVDTLESYFPGLTWDIRTPGDAADLTITSEAIEDVRSVAEMARQVVEGRRNKIRSARQNVTSIVLASSHLLEPLRAQKSKRLLRANVLMDQQGVLGDSPLILYAEGHVFTPADFSDVQTLCRTLGTGRKPHKWFFRQYAACIGGSVTVDERKTWGINVRIGQVFNFLACAFFVEHGFSTYGWLTSKMSSETCGKSKDDVAKKRAPTDPRNSWEANVAHVLRALEATTLVDGGGSPDGSGWPKKGHFAGTRTFIWTDDRPLLRGEWIKSQNGPLGKAATSLQT